MNMSKRDPFPSAKLENDFTFSGFRPQQRKISDKPTHLVQTEEPWSRLHDRATISSSRRSVRHHEHQAPKDSLDFHLKTIYDQHKDCFRSKNQVLYQKETIPEDHQNPDKQDPVVSEWEENIRVWIDPQRRSIYSIK
ncbi:uncharacterized protein C1orf194 homolog [Sphaeramia orbicularis]|uniref:cilia- and flagella-associated protein 276 n=1 Tax=Sphaeramia orbicularis TaxID=375764 RepID=UPI00117FDFBE|nr:uncharacterized protein C1orf194 homolog [Sphaeramia orbicularis]XP_029995430.1 uncharacterized protein C1orf194 homolog [Sphaeramia orbicularis]